MHCASWLMVVSEVLGPGEILWFWLQHSDFSSFLCKEKRKKKKKKRSKLKQKHHLGNLWHFLLKRCQDDTF